MEGYIEEYSQDYWADLPVEIACEIISKIEDLRSLFNHMQASKTFYELAPHCIRELNSKVRMEVPLSSLVKFHNLESLGDNIILTIGPNELELLSRIPRLRKANILLTNPAYGSYSALSSIVINLLSGLNLKQKIPQVNFRIYLLLSTAPTTILIQGDRFGTISFKDLNPLFGEFYPELKHVILSESHSGSERMVSKDFREFLKEEDFGLVDPSQPPSETNPPLQNLFRQLSDSTIMAEMVDAIIRLYSEYHDLVEDGSIIFDQTLKRLLQPVALLLRSRMLPSHPLDRFKYNDLVLARSYFINPSRETFNKFDIPVSSPPQHIVPVIRNALEHYLSDRPYYTTDGTMKTSAIHS